MSYGVVKTGTRDVPMLANGATRIHYQHVFGRNLNSFFLMKMSDEENADVVGELAYIMASAAAGADMRKLNYDGYINWIEGFDALDFATEEAAIQIIDIYQSNSVPSSEVKKNQDRRKGK